MKSLINVIVFMTILFGPVTSASDRAIEIDLTLEAGLEEVWRAWTTPEGVRSFFAPACHIEPRVDGLYEIFFSPQAEPGHRGADGMRILALEPMKRFAFTWNAPEDLPHVRGQRTRVTLKFEPLSDGLTKLSLRHDGWGDGEEWSRAFRYFDGAWKRMVLPRLVYALSHGPIDWVNPPLVEPIPW
jgi:uncharacterized protein YndB with AHSA1/START domain